MTTYIVDGRRKAMTGPPADRFWTKVLPEPNTGCWLWAGSVDRHGYGRFRYLDRIALAHRVAWELQIGKIPSGLVIDHKCRQRACVNPDHMRLVTQWQNCIYNSTCVSAVNAGKTHCKHGHALAQRMDGRRYCRTCDAARCRDKRSRLRALVEKHRSGK